MLKITEEEFSSLVHYMKSNFGINLEKKRTLIEGRLSNYISNKGLNSFGSYFEWVKKDVTGNEVTQLLNYLTTNYSYFMREKDHFDYLKDKILPNLKNSINDYDLRIWSAGCSTGEEPYTMAMLLTDFFDKDGYMWNYKILATDISNKALNAAKSGIYEAPQLDRISALWKQKYFKKVNTTTFELKDTIKEQVIFRSFNLMEEYFPFKKKFHIIFCRNVMIYFDNKTKLELVKRFYDMLEVGGYLFIGQSESLDLKEVPYKYVMPSVYIK